MSSLIMALTLELLLKSTRLMPLPGVISVIVNLRHYPPNKIIECR